MWARCKRGKAVLLHFMDLPMLHCQIPSFQTMSSAMAAANQIQYRGISCCSRRETLTSRKNKIGRLGCNVENSIYGSWFSYIKTQGILNSDRGRKASRSNGLELRIGTCSKPAKCKFSMKPLLGLHQQQQPRPVSENETKDECETKSTEGKFEICSEPKALLEASLLRVSWFYSVRRARYIKETIRKVAKR
jgi:hypothetical protein